MKCLLPLGWPATQQPHGPAGCWVLWGMAGASSRLWGGTVSWGHTSPASNRAVGASMELAWTGIADLVLDDWD